MASSSPSESAYAGAASAAAIATRTVARNVRLLTGHLLRPELVADDARHARQVVIVLGLRVHDALDLRPGPLGAVLRDEPRPQCGRAHHEGAVRLALPGEHRARALVVGAADRVERERRDLVVRGGGEGFE